LRKRTARTAPEPDTQVVSASTAAPDKTNATEEHKRTTSDEKPDDKRFDGEKLKREDSSCPKDIEKYSIFNREDRERIFHGIKPERADSYFPKNPFAFEFRTEIEVQLKEASKHILEELKELRTTIEEMTQVIDIVE